MVKFPTLLSEGNEIKTYMILIHYTIYLNIVFSFRPPFGGFSLYGTIDAYLPDVETIEWEGFDSSEHLQSIYMPKVKTIGEMAFWSAKPLSSVDLSR